MVVGSIRSISESEGNLFFETLVGSRLWFSMFSEKVNDLWLITMLSLISEQFDDDDDVRIL